MASKNTRDKAHCMSAYLPACKELLGHPLFASSFQGSTQSGELCLSKGRPCRKHLFVAHNVEALIFGVGPKDGPEGGWVRCEVCLDVLEELAGAQRVLAAGAGMDNEGLLLSVATLEE